MRFLIGVALCLAQLGCILPPTNLGRPDATKSALVVVSGHVTSTRGAEPEPLCVPGEFIDCVRIPFGAARLQIDDVLFGEVAAKTLLMRVDRQTISEPFSTGKRHRMIFLIDSDGIHHDFHSAYPLAQSKNGTWWVPSLYADAPPFFPCITDPDPEPVDFSEPMPTQNMEELDPYERRALAKGDSLRIVGDVGYYKLGVALEHVRALYANVPKEKKCQV